MITKHQHPTQTIELPGRTTSISHIQRWMMCHSGRTKNAKSCRVLVVLLLSSSVTMCHCRPLLPDHLVEQDFINASWLIDNSTPGKAATMLLGDQRFHKRQRRGSVVALESDKWPNGRIPYVLSTAYSPQQRAVLARAITAYNAKTCIRFVPKTPADKDHVVISKLDGCFADFARVGGKQHVSLADECVEYSTIIHEFMHVVGFIHEHQREDRDGFVQIRWENVIDGASADFEKLSAVGLSNYDEPYDYFSIMHYENTEGSKNGNPTITANAPEYTKLMGKSADFTEGDLNRVNRAYRCHNILLRRHPATSIPNPVQRPFSTPNFNMRTLWRG
uniref:Metalloendopeptidase n=1 Tax=Globodera pallida TaxID=36090 RepID=A0A183BJ64_GLOPA